jgi:hypothetical protein
MRGWVAMMHSPLPSMICGSGTSGQLAWTVLGKSPKQRDRQPERQLTPRFHGRGDRWACILHGSFHEGGARWDGHYRG